MKHYTLDPVETHELVTGALKKSAIPMTPRMVARHTMVPRCVVNSILHCAQRKDARFVKTLRSPANSQRKRPDWVYVAESAS